MNETVSPDVVLLRAADNPDKYLQLFRARGVDAVCQPVLRFVFPNDDALHSRLRRSGQYGGLVATSPRAARALERVIAEEEALQAAWGRHPVYVVGPKTAEQFRTLGFDVQGEESGNASALVTWIADAQPDQPLLFLSGNRRRETVPDGLRQAGVAFDEQVVYETRIRKELSLSSASRGTWLVFFSPSGLEAVRAAQVSLGRYRLASIGPTTAAALEDQGLSVRAVAETPSPEGLFSALQSNSFK